MSKSSALVIATSPYSLSQTIDNIKHVLQEKGVTLFATIDHAQAAFKASLQLADEQVLIFGDPKAGTFLMQENPKIGIELPLKILVWQAANGTTYIGYKDPLLLGDAYNIKKHAEILKKMSLSLASLVEHAIKTTS